jgi:hypothetical protein
VTATPAESLSLEQIEGKQWGPPGPGDTRLAAEVLRLRTVPVADLTTENLRLLIGQQVGLSVLVPLAVQQLQRDPLAEGDYYPGDLLASLLRLPASFWADNPALAGRLRLLVSALDDVPAEIAAPLRQFQAQPPG